jgi:hypothetical protein
VDESRELRAACSSSGAPESRACNLTVSVTSSSLQSLISRFCTDPSVVALLDQDVAKNAQAPNSEERLALWNAWLQDKDWWESFNQPLDYRSYILGW